MNYTKLIAFDLEMCCWNDGRKPSTGEIIEIGLVEIDLEQGTLTRAAQYYVLPEHDEVSEFCTELTGITPHTIKRQGRHLEDVLRTIEKRFGFKSRIYLAWGRDESVLFDECASKGIDLYRFDFINYSMWYKVKSRFKNKRVGMRKAMLRENVEWVGKQHSGVVDAYNLGRLFLQVEGGDISQVSDLEVLMRSR